jgi:tetratricopeptide (TPR) repeat protein
MTKNEMILLRYVKPLVIKRMSNKGIKSTLRRVLLLLLIPAVQVGAQIPASGNETSLIIERSYFILDSLGRTNQPVAVAATLGALESGATADGADLLAMGLRLSSLILRGRTEGCTPSLEAALSNFVTKARALKNPTMLAEALYVHANFQWDYCHNYARSMELRLNGFATVRLVPFTEFPRRVAHYYDLAGKYYHFRDYVSAKKLLREVLAAEIRYPHPGQMVLLNLMGLCHRNLGEYDSAATLFRQAYDESVKVNLIVYQGITKGNLGSTLYRQGRYDQAIPLLESDITYCLEEKRATDNAVKSMCVLSDIWLRKSNMAKAEKLIQQAVHIADTDRLWERFDIREPLYAALSRLHAAKGRWETAYAYTDSVMKVKDTVAAQRNALVLAGAQNIVTAQEHMAELSELDSRKQVQIITRNSLLAGVLLLASIALLVVNRKKINQRRMLEIAEADKRVLDAELESASQQLQHFTRSIQEKNELIESFHARLTSMGTRAADGPSEERAEMVDRLQKSTLLTDDQWESFRKMFDKVHTGYLHGLREQIPGLSQAELRFLALSKLRLSGKEMAGMLGVGADAIRMTKHRVRKKVAAAGKELEELID